MDNKAKRITQKDTFQKRDNSQRQEKFLQKVQMTRKKKKLNYAILSALSAYSAGQFFCR